MTEALLAEQPPSVGDDPIITHVYEWYWRPVPKGTKALCGHVKQTDLSWQGEPRQRCVVCEELRKL